jgi:hypothetical protein
VAQSTEERVAVAQAQLEKLTRIVEDAVADEQRWARAFESEPTQEAFAARAVAEQRAANAKAAAHTCETEVLEPLLRQRESESIARLAAEAEAARVAVMASFDGAADALIAAARAFDAAIAALATYHATRMRCRGGAQLSLEQQCNKIQARLAAIRPAGEYADRSTCDARIRFDSIGGGSQHVKIALVRPATSVPSPLW